MRLVILLLLLPSVARASGSVSLDLAEERFGYSMRQTFRKILAGDSIAGYVEGVRKDFAARSVKVLPAIDKALRGSESLGVIAYDVALPEVYCDQEDCTDPIARARFPGVVWLAPLRFGEHPRHEFLVGLAFAAPPSAKQLAALRGRLDKALAPVASAEPEEPLAISELARVEEKAKAFTVRVSSPLWAREPARARHQARLAALATSVRGRLDALFAAPPPGITPVACTEKMKYWEDNKRRLPGKLSRGADGRLVIYCLGKLSLPALEGWNQKLDEALAGP